MDISEGRPLKVPPGGNRLIDSNKGTLMAIGPREGFEDAVLGIDFLTADKDGEAIVKHQLADQAEFSGIRLERAAILRPKSAGVAGADYRPGQTVTLRSESAGTAGGEDSGRFDDRQCRGAGRTRSTLPKRINWASTRSAREARQRSNLPSICSIAKESDVRRSRPEGSVKIGYVEVKPDDPLGAGPPRNLEVFVALGPRRAVIRVVYLQPPSVSLGGVGCRESRNREFRHTLRHSLAAIAPTAAKDAPRRRRKSVINHLLEDKLIQRVSYDEYRAKVRDVYAGPKGAILATCSMLSLHKPLGERLFRERKFDLRGCARNPRCRQRCGPNRGTPAQVCRSPGPDHLLRSFAGNALPRPKAAAKRSAAIPGGRSVAVAVSPTSRSIASPAVTCSSICPTLGQDLAELARVMVPGGKMLLLTTEDSFGGAWTSRIWCCRTYNRQDLLRTCRELGLSPSKELWFTSVHKLFRAGGICVELVKAS